MKIPDYNMIGKRIRERRKLAKLTQEALAERAGIGIQHISKIENGSTKLSLPCLMSIANALGTTVDNLLMDNIEASKPDLACDAQSIFADCSATEILVMREVLIALKKGLREQSRTDRNI
jgi:transcriptional regulator with XRE-family HTH domain